MLDLLLLSARWTPRRLGASLLAWWDAERADLITLQAGSTVSSWKDIVAGYDAAQATAGARPTYNATVFNGRPGITFDGIDDDLQGPAVFTLPTGAGSGEIWALVDQTASAATDNSQRCITGYVHYDSRNARSLYRSGGGSVNRAQLTVGDGSAEIRPTNASVDFTGRHVVRAIVGATSSQIDVDGVANGAVAVVPVTGGGGQVRIGSRPFSSSQFWNGTHSAVLYTTALSAGQAAQLYAYLNTRK